MRGASVAPFGLPRWESGKRRGSGYSQPAGRFDSAPGHKMKLRPETVKCSLCPATIVVASHGPIRRVCMECTRKVRIKRAVEHNRRNRNELLDTCPKCGNPFNAFWTKTGVCRMCASRASMALANAARKQRREQCQ